MAHSRFQARVAKLRNHYVLSLPDRIAAIAETLRGSTSRSAVSGPLDRQFHNLAGTAGTFGLFSIAATAMDGFDECSGPEGAGSVADDRYLWSIVEELENEIGTAEQIFDSPDRWQSAELIDVHAA